MKTFSPLKNPRANEGCNITGYTVWSIIDNFEWISGFSEKFGIFAVDMKSEKKERIKKSSATFFQNLIKNKSFVF
jgi:beta-glucosidase/6-phospho-beta-glucosidase/beta-galactosidase